MNFVDLLNISFFGKASSFEMENAFQRFLKFHQLRGIIGSPAQQAIPHAIERPGFRLSKGDRYHRLYYWLSAAQ
jgi:hypothetical protein